MYAFPDAPDAQIGDHRVMTEEHRVIPVSLRASESGCTRFLPSHKVVFRDGSPAPLDYEGQRYTFSRTISNGGYDDAAQRPVYVFVHAEF